MSTSPATIGNRIAPPRFLAFGAVAAVTIAWATARLGWSQGVMVGFDVAALVFLGSCVPLLRGVEAEQMRLAARRNDANRAILLALSSLTGFAVLAAVAAELAVPGRPPAAITALVIATLALAWLFGNAVFALHYAHLFYRPAPVDGGGSGGLTFPDTEEPDYADFAYFAATLGMTFQTSDVTIATRAMRRTALAHALVAFVFNLGVVAFSVNVLGG